MMMDKGLIIGLMLLVITWVTVDWLWMMIYTNKPYEVFDDKGRLKNPDLGKDIPDEEFYGSDPIDKD